MSADCKTLGPYSLEREIGRGAFGSVFLARQAGESEPRAIKILHPRVADRQELRSRLRREAKLASHLTSPHAVRIDECVEEPGGALYVVMEYLDGQDLTAVLREQGRLSPERTVRIARQVLEALGEAHRIGIIHRDIKPSNIMLCRRGDDRDFAKVLDFGIAKIAEGGDLQETTRLTVSGGVLGTPAYMSPEQCCGETPTPASDIYSLGILLYELMTGRPPFDHENPTQMLLMQCHDAPPDLPAELADTHVGRAVMRALQKSPDQRFASAAAFAAALVGREAEAEAPRAASPQTPAPNAAGRAGETADPPRSAAASSSRTIQPSNTPSNTPSKSPSKSPRCSPQGAPETTAKRPARNVLTYVVAVGVIGAAIVAALYWLR